MSDDGPKIYSNDNGTTTRYLLIKDSGAFVVSVDEAINDHETSLDTNGIYLLTREGYVISAHIEDVDKAFDSRTQRPLPGYHFQISEYFESRDGRLLEEVVYVDDTREARQRRIVLVEGWDHEITEDELDPE